MPPQSAFFERGLVRSLLLVLAVIQDLKSRALVRVALEDAGHRVIEASGSVQANALLSNGLNPDLVLCDVACSSSSGIAEYRQFLIHTSAQKICLITKISEQLNLAMNLHHLGRYCQEITIVSQFFKVWSRRHILRYAQWPVRIARYEGHVFGDEGRNRTPVRRLRFAIDH